MQLAQFCFFFVLIAASVCSAKRVTVTNTERGSEPSLRVGDELVVDLQPGINQVAWFTPGESPDMIWSKINVDQARNPFPLTPKENTMEEDGSVWAVFEATAPGMAVVQSTLSCKVPSSSILCPLSVQSFKVYVTITA